MCSRGSTASAARDVLDALLALGDPRHHGPELLADLLDLVLGTLGLQALVAGPTALALGHPLGGEAAVLDLVEDLAHLRLHGRVDDPRAAGEVAVLGGVGDGVPHAGDALRSEEHTSELQYLMPTPNAASCLKK